MFVETQPFGTTSILAPLAGIGMDTLIPGVDGPCTVEDLEPGMQIRAIDGAFAKVISVQPFWEVEPSQWVSLISDIGTPRLTATRTTEVAFGHWAFKPLFGAKIICFPIWMLSALGASLTIGDSAKRFAALVLDRPVAVKLDCFPILNVAFTNRLTDEPLTELQAAPPEAFGEICIEPDGPTFKPKRLSAREVDVLLESGILARIWRPT